MPEGTQGPPHGVGDGDEQPGATGPAARGLKPSAGAKMRRKPTNVLSRLRGFQKRRKRKRPKLVGAARAGSVAASKKG